MTTCTHSVVLRHAEIVLSGYGDSPGIPNNNKLLEYCSLMKEWSTVQISLVPRLSHVGGEKRAWYTLFAHVKFPRISGNLEISRKTYSITLTSARTLTSLV